MRHFGRPIRWMQLFALEIASFLTLGLFAAFGGNSVLDAETGVYGGRIGWGITNLFWRAGRVPGTLTLFGLWLLAIMSGFNLWAWIEKWLMRVAEDEMPFEMVPPTTFTGFARFFVFRLSIVFTLRPR